MISSKSPTVQVEGSTVLVEATEFESHLWFCLSGGSDFQLYEKQAESGIKILPFQIQSSRVAAATFSKTRVNRLSKVKTGTEDY
eukprot:g53223.t1